MRNNSFQPALFLLLTLTASLAHPYFAFADAEFDARVEDARDAIDNFEVVVPGKIYRGAIPDANGFAALKALGVKSDISLIMPDEMNGAIFREREFAAQNGIGLFYRPMRPGTHRGDVDEIENTLDVMGNPANYPLYIHCKYGRDRTGMMVGLYRTLIEKSMTPTEAWSEMGELGYRRIHLGLSCTFRALNDLRPSRLCRLLPHYYADTKWLWNPGFSLFTRAD
jgi:hypothetical protein